MYANSQALKSTASFGFDFTLNWYNGLERVYISCILMKQHTNKLKTPTYMVNLKINACLTESSFLLPNSVHLPLLQGQSIV